MKKTAKLFALICTLALVITVMFALSACGGNGEVKTYKFSKAESATSGNHSSTDMSSLYDVMYKDSTITVSDKEVAWSVKDTLNIMSVTRDGDKYLLSGDYVEEMKKLFSSMGNLTYEVYGVETEEGFDIIMQMTMTMTIPNTEPVITVMNEKFIFVK